jgi:hypothetical protein
LSLSLVNGAADVVSGCVVAVSNCFSVIVNALAVVTVVDVVVGVVVDAFAVGGGLVAFVVAAVIVVTFVG